MNNNTLYIFQNTHLPKYGWLQGCYVCNTITAHTETFITNNGSKDIECSKDIEYAVHLCTNCKLIKQHNKALCDLYEYEINEYISTNKT